MSMASSIPSIKLKISHPSLHNSNFKQPNVNPSFIILNSKAEGPLRRPSAPSLSPPPPLTPPTKPITPSQTQPQTQPQSQAQVQTPSSSKGNKGEVVGRVTLEYQRKRAKEMQDYFKQKKLEEADQGPFFGFVAKNEISNGRATNDEIMALFGFHGRLHFETKNTSHRMAAASINLKTIWAMFGFAVGLLTEYATGADFVEQLKILLSNFGIVDLD